MSDERLGAAAFTGSRSGGLALKAAADAVGKPIYLEMSSVNPVFLLPGAIRERRADLVNELAGSCLLGSGQFCTCPNLFVLIDGDEAELFLAELKTQFESRPVGTAAFEPRADNARKMRSHACGRRGRPGHRWTASGQSPGFRYQNTLLRVSGEQFLRDAARLQTESLRQRDAGRRREWRRTGPQSCRAIGRQPYRLIVLGC